METIFNHNVTKEELRKMFGSDNWTRERYEACDALSQVDRNRHIYKLYLLRKNQEKADEYAAKMPDTVEKIFGALNHDFC